MGNHLFPLASIHQAVAQAARENPWKSVMDHTSTLEKIVRGILVALVLIFFLFPIFWIVLMSFQTNETILRIPPSIVFEPTLSNYSALITGTLKTTAGNLDIAFMRNLWNSTLLSAASVALS